MEYIKHHPGNHDGWICLCGNQLIYEGFYPCDNEGTKVEPTPTQWTTDCYVCDACGRIIRMTDLAVVGRRIEKDIYFTQAELEAVVPFLKDELHEIGVEGDYDDGEKFRVRHHRVDEICWRWDYVLNKSMERKENGQILVKHTQKEITSMVSFLSGGLSRYCSHDKDVHYPIDEHSWAQFEVVEDVLIKLQAVINPSHPVALSLDEISTLKLLVDDEQTRIYQSGDYYDDEYRELFSNIENKLVIATRRAEKEQTAYLSILFTRQEVVTLRRHIHGEILSFHKWGTSQIEMNKASKLQDKLDETLTNNL